MKKRLIITSLMLLMLLTTNVDAASKCSYSEQAALNSEVANIKVTYEEATGLVDPSQYSCQDPTQECKVEYNYFVISILNMSKNYYIEATNNLDNTIKTYRYSDIKDGIISFNHENITDMATYTFKVYSSNETNCSGELYRTIYLTTPRKNHYYYYAYCEDNPDYYLCQKYVTFDNIDFYEFNEKMESYIQELKMEETKKQNQNLWNKITDFLDNFKIPIIATVGVLVVGGVTVVIIRKRKKAVL